MKRNKQNSLEFFLPLFTRVRRWRLHLRFFFLSPLLLCLLSTVYDGVVVGDFYAIRREHWGFSQGRWSDFTNLSLPRFPPFFFPAFRLFAHTLTGCS